MSLVQNIKKTINYSKKNGYGEAFFAAWERVTEKYCADYDYHAPDEAVLEAQRNDRSVSDIKFSILVPAFETQEVYMRALIDSCIGQTYDSWELIIADGSASDIVKNTADKYTDKRIKYIKLAENNGIAENTNQAIDYATGDYCALLTTMTCSPWMPCMRWHMQYGTAGRLSLIPTRTSAMPRENASMTRILSLRLTWI